MFGTLLGMLLGVILGLNLVVMACVFCVVWGVSRVLPRQLAVRLCEGVYDAWLAVNHAVLKRLLPTRWDFSGLDTLSPKQFYLLVCNHQTWADILILHLACSGHASHLKFFMKRALLWQLPVASWVCVAMGYPFVHRHSPSQIKRKPSLMGEDLRTILAACHRLKAQPCTLVNFLEGTRYTSQKAVLARSPYQHLLRPQGSGVSVVLRTLEDLLAGLIDVTIAFPQGASMWRLLCGQVAWVKLYAQQIPLEGLWRQGELDDRTYRRQISQQLQALWLEKDARLTAWREVSHGEA